MNKKRCGWLNPSNSLYLHYHDFEWGVPLRDDNRLFEMLILEGAQAGLSWETVLKKRENYRRAFLGFDPVKVASFGENDISRLAEDEGIIRNRLKIKSAVKNAAVFLEIQKEYGSFNEFIWSYTGGTAIDPQYKLLSDIPVKDELSGKISADLKKLGMSFTGPTIIFAYMQAVGMINSHTTDCFRHDEIKNEFY